MAVEELFLRPGVALFAGPLIGVERGWQRRGGAEGSRPAGGAVVVAVGAGVLALQRPARRSRISLRPVA